MAHFQNITSFAELKKQYRTLAIANHPDKGGDTKVMQEINAEFDKLFKVWEHRQPTAQTRTGYETDYEGATSSQYRSYVRDEYRWVGSRYKGQHSAEILELVRTWLKETYPHCKFSVRKYHYNSFHVDLQKADFMPFVEDSNTRAHYDINHYHIDSDKTLTDRAREVMKNVCSYIMSYNYDDSDPMTDYFCTNFYLTLGIGQSRKPFEYVERALTCDKAKMPATFKHPEGKAHKAIRQALSGAEFHEYAFRDETLNVLCEKHYNQDGTEHFYPLSYAGRKTALKRIAKLQAAGIKCSERGYRYSKIVFDGYTPETELALERERREYETAKRLWEEEQATPKVRTNVRTKTSTVRTKPRTTESTHSAETITAEGVEIVDYSEKSFAVIGDTKPIKDLLKKLGGCFNGRLSCGAGWIFSKTKLETVKQTLSIA